MVAFVVPAMFTQSVATYVRCDSLQRRICCCISYLIFPKLGRAGAMNSASLRGVERKNRLLLLVVIGKREVARLGLSLDIIAKKITKRKEKNRMAFSLSHTCPDLQFLGNTVAPPYDGGRNRQRCKFQEYGAVQ